MSAPYSVLISVYNKEKPENLVHAIDSMFNQTVPPDEMVLVCDGPLAEALDAVVSHYEESQGERFKTVRLSKNSGLGEALRAGLSECRNDLVARMDSDDVSIPSRMATMVGFMEKNPSVSVLGGQIAEFVDSFEEIVGVRRVPLAMDGIKGMLPMRNPMNHVTAVFRKKEVLSAGGYIGLKGFEDYYLWARMLASGATFANLDEVVCHVRVSRDMYRTRRGGLSYFKNARSLARYMFDTGLSTRLQYFESIFVRFCQCVLLPAWMREPIFKKALRKKT